MMKVTLVATVVRTSLGRIVGAVTDGGSKLLVVCQHAHDRPHTAEVCAWELLDAVVKLRSVAGAANLEFGSMPSMEGDDLL